MEQRVQESLQKIDNEASNMQRDIEKSYIRKLQGKSMRKGAECCDNMVASAEEVQNCIKQSQQPLVKVQALIKHELEDFQQRLHRCMLSCQDKAKDSMTTSGSMQMEPKIEKMFGDCMCACADEHLKLLPLMKQRLITSMPKI
ncbi:unnamed protein product [Clavelina lepadiformis]|uniref:Protein FAM136A n=1 Tax=Clavelina lepadiformis TaxID=159417 RepID=A0ABP0F8R5_CLALP